MQQGKVKWFNAVKGYGFIEPESATNTPPDAKAAGREEKDGDVFFHYSILVMEGYKTVQEGDQVQYEVTLTPKGWQATSVTPSAEALAREAQTATRYTPLQILAMNALDDSDRS